MMISLFCLEISRSSLSFFDIPPVTSVFVEGPVLDRMVSLFSRFIIGICLADGFNYDDFPNRRIFSSYIIYHFLILVFIEINS